MAEIVHGLSGYMNHKCRCDECRRARRNYERERRASKQRTAPTLVLPPMKWKMPTECHLCSRVALRRVKDKGFCKNHEAEARTAAAEQVGR